MERRQSKLSTRFGKIIKKFESFKDENVDMVIESENGQLLYRGTHHEINDLTKVDKHVLECLDTTFEELKPKRKRRKRQISPARSTAEAYENACLNISIHEQQLFEEHENKLDDSIPSCSSDQIPFSKSKKRKRSKGNSAGSEDSIVDSLISSVLDKSFVTCGEDDDD